MYDEYLIEMSMPIFFTATIYAESKEEAMKIAKEQLEPCEYGSGDNAMVGFQDTYDDELLKIEDVGLGGQVDFEKFKLLKVNDTWVI